VVGNQVVEKVGTFLNVKENGFGSLESEKLFKK
jgi:hypothetical protein